jgi:hypothetical protein
MANIAQLGEGLALCMATTERVDVAGNVAVLTRPAMVLLSVYVSAGGATGEFDLLERNDVPAAGDAAINAIGNVAFNAADAVTEAEVSYIPVEGEEFTETIQVTAGGLGTLLQTRHAIQLTAAELLAPAATPGAKVLVLRGTAVPGAGQAALQDGGDTVQFVAAEAGVQCTATVTYLAFPGDGEGTEDAFLDRLEADAGL